MKPNESPYKIVYSEYPPKIFSACGGQEVI
jgi:hypothetical protein